MIAKRLDAEPVSDQIQQLPCAIEECEREFTLQHREATRPSQFIDVRNYADVGSNVWILSCLAHECEQFSMVVDLTVANRENRISAVADRLLFPAFEKRE